MSSYTHKPYTLAVCMIVKNEAAYLAECLAPLKGFADSLWVVDTGSTDQTVEIARQFTEHVFSHPWQDNFAVARNRVFEEPLQADWVMHIDADERWDTVSLGALHEILCQLDPTAQPYVLNVAFQHVEQRMIKRCLHSGHFPFRFSGRVHETLVLPEAEPQRLDCPHIQVRHLSQRSSAKAAYYEHLLRQELTSALPPRRQAELYWHLADALRQQQKPADTALLQALDALNRAGWQHDWFDYLLLMTAGTVQLKKASNRQSLRSYFERICKLFPEQPAPWYQACWIALYSPRPKQTLPLFVRFEALSQNPDPFFPADFPLQALRLRLLVVQNQLQKAVAQMQQLYHQVPDADLRAYWLFLSQLQEPPHQTRQLALELGFPPHQLSELNRQLQSQPFLTPYEKKLLKKLK